MAARARPLAASPCHGWHQGQETEAKLGPMNGCGAGGLGPNGAADQLMATKNEIGRTMEASNLLPKPPAAAAGLDLEGVEAGGDGGTVPASSSASQDSSAPSMPAMAAFRSPRFDPESEEREQREKGERARRGRGVEADRSFANGPLKG
jgi:hypothetical protein